MLPFIVASSPHRPTFRFHEGKRFMKTVRLCIETVITAVTDKIDLSMLPIDRHACTTMICSSSNTLTLGSAPHTSDEASP